MELFQISPNSLFNWGYKWTWMLNTCIDMGRDVLCKRRGSESKEEGIRKLSDPLLLHNTCISPSQMPWKRRSITFQWKVVMQIRSTITNASRVRNKIRIRYLEAATPMYIVYATGKFFSEALILRVHTHFFPNFSDYF